MDAKKYSFKGWTRGEWLDYITSVGTVFGVAMLSVFFGIIAYIKHIPVPQIAYAIPVGFTLFICAWFFDSMAHLSIWRDVIDRGELQLHFFMVYFAGFPSFICLVLAYWFPSFMAPFIFGFLLLKVLWSGYDELYYHQNRLREGRSDMIEASAHAIQFLSNCVFDYAWLVWIYKYNYIGAGKVVSAAWHIFF